MAAMESFRTRPPRRNRGVAMLLVMIALVVSTILLAGYLSTQGTAVGIARNQRDHDRCRAIAESGADLCMWLIRTKTDWRETMSPGNWLSNYALAGGTVTVAVTDGGGAASFATDNTHPINLTSTGTYNGRSFTVQATMTPLGGGTPWSGGSFARGEMVIGGSARVDSYNSALGPYSSSNHGSNALWWTNSAAAYAFQNYSTNRFFGNVTVPPNASPWAVYYDTNKGPYAVSTALEPRATGSAILPNTTGFANATDYDYQKIASATLVGGNLTFNSVSLTNSAFVTISQSATFRIRGALYIGDKATLKIDSGAKVTILVDDGVYIQGTIQVASSGSLTLYAGNYMEFDGAMINMNGSNANTPAAVQLFGQANCSFVQFEGDAKASCLVYAPAADFYLKNSATFHGSVVANTFTVQGSSKFRQDEAARNVVLRNRIGNASTMGEYRITWQQ